jgi:site-specific DNA-methyltransferase (adenine-specific)
MQGAKTIEWLETKGLIPYAKNSRTHSEAQVAQIAGSIKEFGFNNPVLIDEENGIIAGHGRVMAAQKLGLQAVPCIRLAHLSDTQRKAYVIADNRLALNAGWDDQMLTVELQELDSESFDLSLLGFEADELNALLNPIKETEGLTDEDEVPEVPEEPKTKLGDIYKLGRHRLMCGDSTSIDAVEKLVDGSLVDILITDPPYNVAYEGSNGLKIKNDNMADDQFRQFLRDAFVSADAVMKPGAVFYIWHADLEGFNFRGACKDTGWTVRQCLIWNKNSLVMGRQDYHWKHEPCLYGWKEGSGHLWATDRKQTTILEFKKPKKNDVHPTMKPVELIEYQLLNNTKGADIVLDLFGGSGSTLIAAEKNGRVARLMELDPKYCDVIVKRWEDFTGQKAELCNLSEI